jgi:RNA polymerase sigma-70 factor (ECF subfamily)
LPRKIENRLLKNLVSTHGRRLRRFLRPRVRNVSDVSDIVQETFLRMLRISNQEAIRSPEAYLFTVAHHVAQQHALRESATPISVEISEMLSELHAAADTDPVAQAASEEWIERLDRNLKRFSPLVRATFVLNRHHGLSLEQISEHLNISYPMAKKYLLKAVIQLRQHMEQAE